MKTTILVLALALFSFNAHAEGTTSNTCVDVSASLVTMSESTILGKLLEPGCGMSLMNAVGAIIAAGGVEQATLTAALAVDPQFIYADPTKGLAGTAAGGPTGGTNNVAFNFGAGTSGGGGTSP